MYVELPGKKLFLHFFSPVISGAAGERVDATCWEAGTGCTTGAWADEVVRSVATLLVVSDAPSELCMLR